MKINSKSHKRRLRAEKLESRQLLHGGGFAEAMQDRVVTAMFNRLDTNDDGVVLVAEEGGDELHDRVWEQISAADVEGSEAGVTVEELKSYVSDRVPGRPDRPDRPERPERPNHAEDHDAGDDADDNVGDDTEVTLTDRIGSMFDRLDTNGDGVILVGEEGAEGSDEIHHRLWEQVAAADVEGSEAGVTVEELAAYIEARMNARPERPESPQRPERPEHSRESLIAASVERVFASRDADENGILTEDELGGFANRFADADTDGEEGISATEMTDYLNAQIANRHENHNRGHEDPGEEVDGGERPVVEEANAARVGRPHAIAMARRAMRRRRR